MCVCMCVCVCVCVCEFILCERFHVQLRGQQRGAEGDTHRVLALLDAHEPQLCHARIQLALAAARLPIQLSFIPRLCHAL